VRDPATGQIVCRAKLLGVDASSFGPQSLIDNCVPINLFGDSRFSDDAVRYVTTPTSPNDTLSQHHHLVQHDAELVASGQFSEGWGAGPLSGAFGISYRKQELKSFETPEYLHDQSTPTNNVPGIRGVPGGFAGDIDIHQFDSFTNVNGELNVKEAFFETLVPIVAGVPFVQQLNANASARWADYSGSGDIWAYKVGLDWQLIDDLRLRGTYSRDVRAASLAERFDTDRGSGTVADPVTGNTVTFSQTNGGNPEVAPEEADTYTFGAVFQPRFLNGFSLSIDWWQIDVAGAIGQLGAQKIVDDCLAGATSLCALITRDPATQTIVDLKNVFININKEKATGLDIEAAYSRNVDFFGGGAESIGFRVFGAHLNELSRLIPGAPLDDSAGDILNGTPEWFATATLNYQNGPWSFDIKQTHIGSGLRNTAEIEGIHIDENDVPAANYTDLRLGYQLDRPGGTSFEIFANVINLFDETPPLAVANWSSNNGSTQTNTDLYDVKGRRYVLGARFEF
jgi:iron complex outermembrane recepter protein